MSHWNYRVIRRETDGVPYYAIYEVYYNEADEAEFWSQEPVAPSGNDLDDLHLGLDNMRKALAAPVLLWGEMPQGTTPT